jgi:acetate kinase
MLVLMINSGSSSIKFRLIDVVEEARGVLTTQSSLLEGAVKGTGGVVSFELMERDAAPSKTT